MVSFTLKEIKTGKISMKFYRSTDKLKRDLMFLAKDDQKRNVLSIDKKKYEVIGISYDDQDEGISLLRRTGLIPKESDYPQIES